jgi:hypothetical protein
LIFENTFSLHSNCPHGEEYNTSHSKVNYVFVMKSGNEHHTCYFFHRRREKKATEPGKKLE